MLIGYYGIFILSREAKCLLASLAFNASAGNNVIFFLTRQPQIDTLHILRQGGRCVVCSDAFSCEIHSAPCKLKENDEIQRYERSSLFFDIGIFFGETWPPLASMNTSMNT